MLDDLKIKYDKLQKKYGSKELDSIYYGGCTDNPDICFVFMNPTKRNIASDKAWQGRKSPWIGIKNVWQLFNNTGLMDNYIFEEIQLKRPDEWDYDFADKVYDNISKNKYFLTNLGKCTQDDARSLPNKVLGSYLALLHEEIKIIKPKIIITFGNQVSSIILEEKISVSLCRKKSYNKEINGVVYKIYPVYYPIGNGRFNLDKAIEDIKWIIKTEFSN